MQICYYLAKPEHGLEGWNFAFDDEYYIPLAHNGSTWIGYEYYGKGK